MTLTCNLLPFFIPDVDYCECGSPVLFFFWVSKNLLMPKNQNNVQNISQINNSNLHNLHPILIPQQFEIYSVLTIKEVAATNTKISS